MKRYLPAILLGLAIALGVSAVQGLFASLETKDVYRVLSDGFFAATLLIGGMGLMTWMAGQGQLMGLKYVFYRARMMYRWGYPRKQAQSFGDYKTQQTDKEAVSRYFLLPGAIFAVLTFVFYFLYNSHSTP